MEKMLCIAGFGDNSTMFAPILDTALSTKIDTIPFDLPGFGAPAIEHKSTTLDAVAEIVDDRARDCGASVILAHSVSSIIASLAAQRGGSPIETILSLEGNLTAEDAYFSGTAARYDSPLAFREAFLDRLSAMAADKPEIARYRAVVETADPPALWTLGRDANRFSADHVPGEALAQSANAVYLFNPDNLPEMSLRWLKESNLPRIELTNATHWASVDQPELLAAKAAEALTMTGVL